MNDSIILAWLSTKINLNLERYSNLIKTYTSIQKAIEDDFQELKNPKWIQKYTKPVNLDLEIEKFGKILDLHQIKIITILNKDFPEQLKYLEKDTPIVLYFQGDLQLLRQKQFVTTVGSRDINHYSKMVMQNILKPSCRLGINVVSGLALGVDGLSHQIAIENQAKTIAVIGSGLDDQSFYPLQNLGLKRKILETGGLILSEYQPGFKATIYNFPRRNRILAALTELTWVVQASKRSGTLITAAHARDIGKIVATTPASILDNSFSGNLKLIRDGVNIITEPEDILQLLGLSTIHTKADFNLEFKTDISFSCDLEKSIYYSLSLTPVNTEDIAEKLTISIPEVVGFLTLLEINGLATNMGLNQWVRGS